MNKITERYNQYIFGISYDSILYDAIDSYEKLVWEIVYHYWKDVK